MGQEPNQSVTVGSFRLDKQTSAGIRRERGIGGDSLGAISHIKLSQGASNGRILPYPVFLVPPVSPLVGFGHMKKKSLATQRPALFHCSFSDCYVFFSNSRSKTGMSRVRSEGGPTTQTYLLRNCPGSFDTPPLAYNCTVTFGM